MKPASFHAASLEIRIARDTPCSKWTSAKISYQPHLSNKYAVVHTQYSAYIYRRPHVIAGFGVKLLMFRLESWKKRKRRLRAYMRCDLTAAFLDDAAHRHLHTSTPHVFKRVSSLYPIIFHSGSSNATEEDWPTTRKGQTCLGGSQAGEAGHIACTKSLAASDRAGGRAGTGCISRSTQ